MILPLPFDKTPSQDSEQAFRAGFSRAWKEAIEYLIETGGPFGESLSDGLDMHLCEMYDELVGIPDE